MNTSMGDAQHVLRLCVTTALMMAVILAVLPAHGETFGVRCLISAVTFVVVAVLALAVYGAVTLFR